MIRPIREHTISMRVPFADVDMVGIVYTARFADYFLRGWEEYFRTIGIPWESFAAQNSIRGMPVVNLSFRFKSPARCADVLHLTTRVTKLTRRRIYFRFELFNRTEERLVALGSMVVAAIDKNFKPTAIPDFVTNAITGRSRKRQTIHRERKNFWLFGDLIDYS